MKEVIHPGEYLYNEICKKENIEVKSLAKKLGYTEYYFKDVIRARKPLTPSMAEKIGWHYNISPNALIRMQKAYEKVHGKIDYRSKKNDGLPRKTGVPLDLIKKLRNLNDYLKDHLQHEYPGRQRTYEFINNEKRLTKAIDEALKSIGVEV